MVAIKDMEMPKGCLNCDFYEGINTYCDGDILIPYGFFDDCRENKRHPDCPLVEIGTCKDCEHWCHFDGYDSQDTCKLTFRTRHSDFYCADFEKRHCE